MESVTFFLESGTSLFQKIKEVQPILTKTFYGRHTRKAVPHFVGNTVIYQRQRPIQNTRLIKNCSRAFLCLVENFFQFFLKKFASFSFQCVVMIRPGKNTGLFRRHGEVAA